MPVLKRSYVHPNELTDEPWDDPDGLCWPVVRAEEAEAEVDRLRAEVKQLREVEQAARTYFKEFDHLVGDWSQHDYPERRAMRDSLNAVARSRDNAS